MLFLSFYGLNGSWQWIWILTMIINMFCCSLDIQAEYGRLNLQSASTVDTLTLFLREGSSCGDLKFNSDWNFGIGFLDRHAGKELVKLVSFDGETVIFKSENSLHRLGMLASAVEELENKVTPLQYLQDWIIANYSPFMPDEFLRLFNHLDEVELEIAFQLVQQNEFFYLLLNNFLDISQHHFPRLIVTCGSGYLIEMVPEVVNDHFILNKPWREMLPVVNSFLDLAEECDEKNLHLCDVQLHNFGWDATSGHVKILDLDHVFFGKLLSDQFIHRSCNSDADCVSFDCQSSCQVSQKMCYPEVVDDNLARMCRNIFRPNFVRRGLLSFFPLPYRRKLLTLAEKCGVRKSDRTAMLEEIRTELSTISHSMDSF